MLTLCSSWLGVKAINALKQNDEPRALRSVNLSLASQHDNNIFMVVMLVTF